MYSLVDGTQDCSDGYMCKTHVQIKNEMVVSHPSTSADVQTCLPMEVSGLTCHILLFSFCEENSSVK